MLRMLASGIRCRPGRNVAQFLGVALAAMSFALLTATSSASTLDVIDSVRAANRPAYDILVRPHGSRLASENADGLVQPGYLSGIYGGITREQWRTVAAIPGVGVAAPVAMIGYGTPALPVSVDLQPYLAGVSGRQVLRVDTSWNSDRGLTSITGPPTYLYATDRPLQGRSDQRSEVLADGSLRPVCRGPARSSGTPDPPAAQVRCWSPTQGDPVRPAVRLGWTFPYLIAAVDPVAEAKLAGLDRAVVSGRYLTDADRVGSRAGPAPGSGRPATWNEVPVLVAAKPQVDRELRYRVTRLAASSAEIVARGGGPDGLADDPGTVLAAGTLDVATAYDTFLRRFEDGTNLTERMLTEFFSTGPVGYTPTADGGVSPQVQQVDQAAVWGPASAASAEGSTPMPEEMAEPAFRRVMAHRAAEDPSSQRRNAVLLSAVGRFDVTRLPAWNTVSAVPMETYFAAAAGPGDDAAHRALGGRSLAPSANIGGFLGQPPSIMTTLDALPAFLDGGHFSGIEPARSAAPLSVIRVRLAGDIGLDDVSREKVRLVAEQITNRTGLDVDIMVGSSPVGKAITLAAGAHGRPELRLSQAWAKKGVVATIVDAVDRKSFLLFTLILVVCALVVANSTTAAVRSRRLELAILACLGWRRRTLYRYVVAEAAGHGLLASLAGGLLALPGAAALGLHPDPRWLLAAVPATTAVTVLAALRPAWIASRSDPATAARPSAAAGRRHRPPTTVRGFAWTNAIRNPGRTAIGAASLAVGVSALTLLTAVHQAFHGAVVGTLLGDAVSVRARAGDYLAAVITLLLGGFAVADVVYLNVRERGTEFATLRAVGWRERELARIVMYETLLVGALGAVLGVAAGCGLLAGFAGGLPAPVWQSALAVGLGAIALAGVSATVPMVAVARLSTSYLLGE